MDPDMVRQQEEAEREALGLSPTTVALQQSSPQNLQQHTTFSPKAPNAVFPAEQPTFAVPEVAYAPEVLEKWAPTHSKAAALGRLLSVAVAGAMLGTAAGIAIGWFLEMTHGDAQKTLFASSAAMAIVCVAAFGRIDSR